MGTRYRSRVLSTSGGDVSFVKLTRMVEQKSKGGPRGELRAFAFRGVSPIWVAKAHVSAVGTFQGYVTDDNYELEERDITEVRLAGASEFLYVGEPIGDVLEAFGIGD
jgi:hypothetical protein